MGIDKTGEWWKEESYSDLAEYVTLLRTEGYFIDKVIQCTCACENTMFRLLADRLEGCAQRICPACGAEKHICDSADIWEEADPEEVRCVCGHTIFELGVGFSLREGDEVRWITVGQRCVECGVLGSFVNWKINYGPSAHLLEMT